MTDAAQIIEAARKSGDWDDVPDDVLAQYAEPIITTTAPTVAGRDVDHEIEVITAECVYGMNIFRDIFAGVRDFFGGRSGSTQKILRDARRTCMTELKIEALMVGGDAVIGIDLDYSEFSGGSKNGMLFLVASGTAVKLKA